jgi:hypothetical protein
MSIGARGGQMNADILREIYFSMAERFVLTVARAIFCARLIAVLKS